MAQHRHDRGACDAGAVPLDENLHVVVAGLMRRAGRGLLIHRSPTLSWYPDCWDLPGGHIEAGEASDATLRRELVEELGVTVVTAGAAFARIHGEDFHMDVWVLDQWVGEPQILDPTEHDALAWLDHHEMASLKLADARLSALFEAVLR